jgi:hypothetical protein
MFVLAELIGFVGALSIIVCTFVALRRRAIRRRRKNARLCPGCGYDIRATPQRCPECAEELDDDTAVAGPESVEVGASASGENVEWATGPDQGSAGLVVIARFRDESHARLAAARLEDEDVGAVVMDRIPHHALGARAATLAVPAEDVKRATTILEQTPAKPFLLQPDE